MLAAASWKRADQETTAKYQAQADLERQAYSQAHKIYLANRQKAEREEAAARTAAAAAVAMHFEQEQVWYCSKLPCCRSTIGCFP